MFWGHIMRQSQLFVRLASLLLAENPCLGGIMRKRLLSVRPASLFLAENLCSDKLMRQTQLIMRQTKLIVSFASLFGENEHFTGGIVRIAV